MKGFIVKRIFNDEISYVGWNNLVDDIENARIFKTKKGARRERYQQEHYWDDPFNLFGVGKPENEIFVVEEI